MGSATTAPPPPSTAEYSDALSGDANQMRDWAQSMWDSGQAEMDQINQYSQEFAGMTMPAAEESFDWARTQRDRFNEHVMPQMQSLYSEAERYASKEQEDLDRGKAIQDVKAATEAQRESQLRKLEGYGVDPSMTRYQSLDKQAGVTEAALSALAANNAGERTKQVGRDLRRDAINTGTGFLNDAAGSNTAGANIGAMGSNVMNAGANTGINLQQGAQGYMQGAGQATDTAAGIVDTSYGRELNFAEDARAAEAADAAGMAGMANLAGMALAPMTGGTSLALAGMAGGADGGPVAAPGGPTSDSGVLKISNGEYVIPADVVRKLGTNHFDKVIEKETGRAPPSMKVALPVGGA